MATSCLSLVTGIKSYVNNFETVNNPTVMLRTEAGGYTDGNSIGNMTMLKIN